MAKSKDDIAAEVLAAMKNIIRRAIMTLWTLKHSDRKYQPPMWASGWLFTVVRDKQESYGWVNYGFDPTEHDISQMEIVAGWLAWLRREEGDTAIRRLAAWTHGMPLWRIGRREGCSDRTILNRIDRSVVAILRKFADANLTVEIVEDPKVTNPYSMVTEPNVVTGQPVTLRKVYIYDEGFFIGSRRWRDGRHKVERLLSA